MAANENWPRWIEASTFNYLKTVADNEGYANIREGIDTRTDEFKSADLRVELRVVGPSTIQTGPNDWIARVFVNVLIVSTMGELKNRFLPTLAAGKFHAAMDADIPITKCGAEPGDDDSLIGCLSTVPERNTPVRTLDFGEIDTTDRQRQKMVSATYFIELSN